MNHSLIPQISKPSSASITIAIVAVAILLTGCSRSIEKSPAYQAACHGPPLRSIEQINKAMEDGYLINRQYKCIDKASFSVVEQRKAEWEAANTPEAIARRKAEFAAQRERDIAERAERSRQVAAEESLAAEPLLAIVLRDIDVNTASEADIASVITLNANVAAQIVEERNKRRFTDWADLGNRVVGLSAAQPAVYASICGLTVNGRSLEGAPPDPTMAAMLQRKYQQYKKYQQYQPN
jgi:hypothetical protein